MDLYWGVVVGCVGLSTFKRKLVKSDGDEEVSGRKSIIPAVNDLQTFSATASSLTLYFAIFNYFPCEVYALPNVRTYTSEIHLPILSINIHIPIQKATPQNSAVLLIQI